MKKIIHTDRNFDFSIQALCFDRVITLGQRCKTKGIINWYFNPTESPAKTKKGHADVFDWISFHNYDLLADALKNNLHDIFEWDNFDWLTLTNKKYEIHWNHLFDTRPEKDLFDQPIMKTPDYPDPEFIKQNIECIPHFYPFWKAKIDYLRDRFLDAKRFTTLYVITEAELSKETLQKLSEAILSIREGDSRYLILYVPEQKKYESDLTNRYVVFECAHKCVFWDIFDSDRWAEILNHFSFSKNIWD